jgi:8-oxo-dGTP pyrophosphatase MutT (NUDIX family)
MSDTQAKPAAPAVPAATILLIRDGANGLEVFMVKRHHQIDFATGALVFPGGKATKSDFDPVLGDHMDGAAAWSSEMRAIAAAAIREAFEEAGILLARDGKTGEFIDEHRLAQLDAHRQPLEKGEMSLRDLVEKENLRLACDHLVHFAHWITPTMMPKRFDTHFFVALAPHGHSGHHDGRESVDSVWITPDEAVADRKRWNIIFPTKLNLMKLAQSKSVDAALEAARAAPPLTVEPWVEQGADGAILRIRDDAGYEQTWTSMRDGV